MRPIASLICLCLASLSLMSCQAPQPAAPATPSSSPAPSANAIAVGKSPHGIAAGSGFVYNSNSAENTISVLDARSNQLVKTLTVPSGHPGYIKASHDGKYLLVASPDAGQLYLYAPSQDHRMVQTIAVGKNPDQIVISNDDRKVWVSLAAEAAIAELDFSKGFEQAPALRKLATGQTNPNDEHRALAVGGRWLATNNTRDNNVSLIELATGVQQSVTAGNNPAVIGLASWDGQERMLIIGNSASHTVTLYDIDTKTTTTLSDLGQTPTSLAVVPGLERVFITMAGSNDVAVIDYRQRRLVGRIPVGSRPVHIYLAPESLQIQHEGHDHGTNELWVGNDGGDSVSVIDAATLTVKRTQAVGKGHHKMAFWGQKAFVSNITDGTVSVIDRN